MISGNNLFKRVLSIPTLISFVGSIVLVYLLLQVFDIDWSEVQDRVKGINLLFYAIGLMLYYSGFFLRALRWRLIAENAATIPTQERRPMSLSVCILLLLSGWFLNSIAWLRVGDAYRAYEFGEETAEGFSWSLGTIMAERVLDMVIVALMLLVAAWAFWSIVGTSNLNYVLVIASAMVLILIGVLLLLRVSNRIIDTLFAGRIHSFIIRFRIGTLNSFSRLPILVALGILSWLVEVARVIMVTESLGFEVPMALMVIVALSGAIFSTVPTPGGIGVVEPGVTGILLLQLKSSEAASFVIVDRSITYLSVLVFGGCAFLLQRFLRIRRSTRNV